MHSSYRTISALVLAAGSAGGVLGQNSAFSAIELPIEPVQGEIIASGLRAWTWTDPGAAGSPVTHRLVLERDVEISLAGYDLMADSAVLWISPRPDVGDNAVQVFAHLTGVDTPSADASVSLAAETLSVQGVILLTTPIDLAADAIEQGPVDSPATLVADVALSNFMGTVLSNPLQQPAAIEQLAQDREGTPLRAPGPGFDFAGALPRAQAGSPIMTARGIVSMGAGRIIRTLSGQEQFVILEDGVNITYREPGTDRVLELSSQRAVVFFAGQADASVSNVRASDIDGIYLEGDVIASDGRYNLRGPRVFYDVRNDKALILDAVFSTFDTRVGFPLYVRARSVRQLSETEFIADRASISNTAFARPNLTIGARTVTIRQETTIANDGSEQTSTIADADDITLNTFALPVGYLPTFEGDPEDIPLRDVQFVFGSKSGEEIRTTWDLYSLLGLQKPDGLSAELQADALLDRGPGLGLNADWRGSDYKGSLLTYWVFNDTGTDSLTTGADFDRSGENRGIVRAEHIAKVGQDWAVFAEVAHVSDENFVDAFFEDLAETGREFTNRIHARKLTENSSLTLEAKGQFDDFTPNEYILQSDGYNVQKLPEVTYTRLADDLLESVAPGHLLYTSEYRVGNMSLAFTDKTPAEYGLTSNAKAQAALGINANTKISDALRAQGFSEGNVLRADTRHELAGDLSAGPIKVLPWAVGRGTIYDDDFETFAGDNDNSERIWGAVGVTLATTIQRVENELYSRALDVNRVRHIVRPSVTAFYSDTNVDQDELPVYDESVESLADGTVVRLGLDQTWQTKRGGPGRWYSVDWITLDSELVFASDDAISGDGIGRYYESRPENSRLSNFGTVTATMQATDSFALVGSTIYDFEQSGQSQTAAGFILDHSPTFSSNLSYRYLGLQDSTLLNAGTDYTLTEKYTLGVDVTYDTDIGDLQSIRSEVLRDFQNAVFGVNFTYNKISDDTSVGVIFQPLGRGTAAQFGSTSRSASARRSGGFGG